MDYGQNQGVLRARGVAGAVSVAMLYHGTGSALIRGPVTGQIYQFPRQEPVQPVNALDVVSLIRTRLFTPAR